MIWKLKRGKTGYKCTCVTKEHDADKDGTKDCDDECPNNPALTKRGICGCQAHDSDSDGKMDCKDKCPKDAIKAEPGICGCHVPDRDVDGDGVLDCKEEC